MEKETTHRCWECPHHSPSWCSVKAKMCPNTCEACDYANRNVFNGKVRTDKGDRKWKR